jgi:tetratricopeptide (TPR) repeat protein
VELNNKGQNYHISQGAGRLVKYVLIISVFIYSLDVQAQSQGYFDSLTRAKTLLNEGLIKDAAFILHSMETSYPGDENIIRLSGQAIYWSKDFSKTKEYYSNSIHTYPSLQYVKLDYGRILYELQSYREAEPLLESFILANPEHPEANQLLAQINYWLGGNPNKSYQYLDKILKPYPENEAAKALWLEIEKTTSPVFSIRTGYISDSQPMAFSLLEGTFGLYKSAMLQPTVSSTIRSYQSGQLVSIFSIVNKSSFIQTGTSIIISGGLAKTSSLEKSTALYGLELDQKIKSGFTATFSANKESYFYTLTSLDQMINPNTIKASLGRDYEGKFSGRIWFQNSSFKDSNWVKAFGAWLLYPILQIPGARVELGYSFTQGDSKEVRFAPNLPIQDRVNSTSPGTVILGSYQPYFTPINQQIHGLLAKFSFSPKSAIKIDLTGNVGLKASIDNPNMVYYGISNSQANRPITSGDLFLILSPQSYTPWDVAFNFNWELSDYSSFQFSYKHQTTVFFNSNDLNLKFIKRLKK